MILKSIRLKNFKCYENYSQDFDLGITSICGENGAGKSSILEAISWVLFNFLPYSATSKIIRSGAKSAEVELHLQSNLDGEEYVLKRKTQGQTNVYSLKDKSIVTEGVGNLQQWIRHHLGLRNTDNLSSICRNGIATPQGNLNLDFLESPENRRRIFDVLLGLDEYKVVHNSLGDVLKLVNEKSNELKIDLAKSDYVEEELKKIAEETKVKQQEMLELQAKVTRFESELNQLTNEVKEAKETKIKFDEVSKDKARNEKDLQEIQDILKNLIEKEIKKKSIDESAKKYEEVKEKRKVLIEQKNEFDVLTTRKVQLEETLKLEKENIQKTEKEIQKLEKLKEEFKTFESSVKDYEQLQSKEKELSRQKSQYEAELNLKQQFQEQLQAYAKESAELTEQIKTAEEKVKEVEKLPELEKELEDKRSEFNEVSKLEKQKKELLWPPNPLKGEQDSNFVSAPLGDGDSRGPSTEHLKDQIHTKETELQKNIAEKNKLEAQIEVNKKLLPELIESVKCPLLNEPCKNLSEKATQITADQKLSEQETDFKSRILELDVLITGNKTDIEELKKLNEVLIQLESISKEINNRSSEELIGSGKELRTQVEELRKTKVLVDNLTQTKEKLNKTSADKQQIEKKLKDLELKENFLIKLKVELDSTSQTLKELKVTVEKALVMKSEIEKEVIFQSMYNEQKLKLETLENQFGSTNQNLEKLVQVPDLLKDADKVLEELEPVFIEWSQLLKEIEIIPETKDKKNQITIKIQEEQELINNLQENLKDDHWITGHNQRLEVKQKEFNEIAGLLHSITYVLKEKEEKLTELKNLQSELESHKEKLNATKITGQKVSKMRGYFKELSIQMAKQYTDKISKKATDMFREIMQDSSYELEWTEDYEILMYKNGQKLSFEGLSGGQQVASSIAIRLGLLQELSNIRFAFFDEPTAHLDVERRNQLAMQISSIKSFDQLFVITHDESFASQANNVITVGV